MRGQTVLGDERGCDGGIAGSSGNGHGVLGAGFLIGAGLITGAVSGIDGRVSFAEPGFICVGLGFATGIFIGSPAFEDFFRAATAAGTGAGELLVPL